VLSWTDCKYHHSACPLDTFREPGLPTAKHSSSDRSTAPRSNINRPTRSRRKLSLSPSIVAASRPVLPRCTPAQIKYFPRRAFYPASAFRASTFLRVQFWFFSSAAGFDFALCDARPSGRRRTGRPGRPAGVSGSSTDTLPARSKTAPCRVRPSRCCCSRLYADRLASSRCRSRRR
jgi:hypothetical protein